MKKGRELLSLPVVESINGNHLGEIKDLIICNNETLEVKGLIVENKTWFCDAKILPYERIKQINKDILTIENEEDIIDITCNQEINDNYNKQKEDSLIGKKIFSNNGESLGFIGDVLISTETGIIVGYELSDGFVQDLLEGRSYIALPSNFSQEKDSLHLYEEPLFINPLFEVNNSIES